MPRPSDHSGKGLARCIRQAAAEFNFSIRQVLKDIGISRTTFYRWGKGLSVPTPEDVSTLSAWVTKHRREPDNIRRIRQLWESLTRAGVPCFYRVWSNALELQTAPDNNHRVFVLTCTHTGGALKIKMAVAGVETTLTQTTLNEAHRLGEWLINEWGGQFENTTINTVKRDVNLDRLESGIKRFMNRRKTPNDYVNTTVRA